MGSVDGESEIMTSLNISLPDSMRQFVEEQVAAGGYSTASEYVRELIRTRQKERAQARLEQLLLEGLDSGPPIEVNDFDKLARHLQERATELWRSRRGRE